MKRLLVRLVDRCFVIRGFAPGWGIKWLKSALRDLFGNKTVPLKQRLWAFRRGFYSYRIAHYGLTPQNWREFVSDRDYDRAFPINSRFQAWVDDKLTTRLILAPFREHLPEYYYHLDSEAGSRILRLMDCPPDAGVSLDDIVTLLESKGDLALKRLTGSCGLGFYRLTCQDGRFLINLKEATRSELLEFLRSLADYLVMEYVRCHPALARFYPHSLNTVRIMVINERGDSPFLADAFLKIGTTRSGALDNIGAGGMFARVDVETGRFFHGESEDAACRITDCLVHPDTGLRVEGSLPHWEMVKNGILAICRYLPQLEYLGFDLGITPEGFKVIEINSHQGLHRFHRYPPRVKEYLRRVVNRKKLRTPPGNH